MSIPRAKSKKIAGANTALFERHYTLQEAVTLIPELEHWLDETHDELELIRNDIILYKRLHLARRKQPMGSDGREIDVLQKKYDRYEQKIDELILSLKEKSILVKDFERGIIEFPYKNSKGEEFLLSWQEGDEGILHFTIPGQPFGQRFPITVLPE